MPKIVENAAERLVAEAKRQTLENGYNSVTVRSVVSACGMSVGTFYNYFSSKEQLVARFMIADWQDCIDNMTAAAKNEDAQKSLEGVFNTIRAYCEKYADLFRDSGDMAISAKEYYARHAQLRSGIAAAIAGVCKKNAIDNTPLFASFIAENLLVFASEARSFSELWGIISSLFANK